MVTQEKNTSFIDFDKLSKKETKEIADKWHSEAVNFEQKLYFAQRNAKEGDEERIAKMWKVAHNLWKRALVPYRYYRQKLLQESAKGV